MWTAAEIVIELVDEVSEGRVVTVRITTPAGAMIMTADVERYDDELVLAGLHIQTDALRPNSLGWPRLRQLACAIAEKVNVDAIVVKGAARTTGARYGRIPGHLRFIRPIRPSG